MYFLLHEVLEKTKLIYCLKKNRIIACGGWRQALAEKEHEGTFKTDDILIGNLGYTGV